MFRNIWMHMHRWLVPSHHNDFHPHLIAERGLLILFALILGTEAFLVSNVLSLQSGAPSLAAVGVIDMETALPPILAQVAAVWTHYTIGSLGALAMQPNAGRIALLVLACTAALLMGLLAFTLAMRHRNYKPVGYVAGGTMLAFVATLLFFNTHVLLPFMVSNQMANVAALAVEDTLGTANVSASSSTAAWTLEN